MKINIGQKLMFGFGIVILIVSIYMMCIKLPFFSFKVTTYAFVFSVISVVIGLHPFF